MHEEDKLLHQLAAHHGQQDADWQATLERLALSEELLTRFAAGELSEAEEASLQSAAEASPEAAAIVAAYAPLSTDFQSALLTRLDAAESPNVAEATSGPATTPRGSVTALEPKARGRRRAMVFALPSALAAGLLLALVLPTLLADRAMDALPAYVLQVGGQTAEVRADPTTPLLATPTSHSPIRVRLSAGNQLQLTLTPATDASAPVQTRLYLREQAAGPLTDVALAPGSVRTAATGAVRIDARVGEDIALPPGSSHLLVVVGRTDALPTRAQLPALLGELGAVAGEQWQAFALELVLSE